MSVQKINSPERMLVPMYSHAVKIPGLIFCSGQTPMDSTGNVAQCLSNLTDVLNAAGSSWDKVVKVNIYLKSMGDYAAMNEVYIKTLPDPKPARTCIQAGGLPWDVDVEIEAIAAV
ncbi:Endoribonuclease L-PSP [Suillus fuscotomentosus]|uniref:Endoribonuclease L-PSP n=1 Tax=Suillus fuscotomentosus TaxID=1912939 RepID=A0AAD4HIV7_9AGAM|nr:Endoribonuclease L-PSP [Suillus fuscotomentosus]KAG1833753.1 Endoribonuclease L-PSP [Suillus variegatus]KAG1899265.1 Endoribonuclease L-PSP [Suillus fuscotomentosus]